MFRTGGVRLVALVGVIAIGPTACGGGHRASPPLPRAALPAPSTTSTTADPNRQVVADLQSYYDTYYRVAAAPDPRDPGIAEHMTGSQLIGFRGFIEGLVHDGEVARGSSVDRRFAAASVQGRTATVDECDNVKDPGHLFGSKSGRQLAAWGTPGASSVEITMQQEGGTWKVANTVSKAVACS
jgi:hypothetical protein